MVFHISLKSWLSRKDSLPFKERSFGSTGIDLGMKIFQWDRHRSLTFPVKRNEISYFYMFNSISGYKRVMYKSEIHSLELEHSHRLRKCWFALHISLSLILPYFFLRGHGNISFNLIGSLRGPYPFFPTGSISKQRRRSLTQTYY